LSSICIPSSVEIIGKNCFSGCPNLRIVTFGDDSRLSRVEEGAFSGCPLDNFRFPPPLSLVRRIILFVMGKR
jgi:hypothetical protein